jgi:hypothetical protein
MSDIKIDTKKLREIADAIVEESRGDYVGLWDISTIIRRAFGSLSNEDAKRLSLDVVRLIIRSGLRPGDYLQTGFKYWTENPEQIVSRIDREWDPKRGDPTLFESICWFDQPKA